MTTELNTSLNKTTDLSLKICQLQFAHYIFIYTGQGQGRLKVNLNCLQVIGYVFPRYNNHLCL